MQKKINELKELYAQMEAKKAEFETAEFKTHLEEAEFLEEMEPLRDRYLNLCEKVAIAYLKDEGIIE